MNLDSTKYVNYIFSKEQDQGFTLIELLVVVIIIGVLSALSLPSLLKQVEKARTTEARTIIGTINRTQQAHRLEFSTFGELGDYYLGGNPALGATKISLDPTTLTDANGDGAPDNQLTVNIQPEFYQFTDGRDATNLSELTSTALGTVDATIAEVFAVSIPFYDNDILDYATQVSQDTDGNFSSIICVEAQLNASDNGSNGPVGNGSTTTLATACIFGTEVN